MESVSSSPLPLGLLLSKDSTSSSHSPASATAAPSPPTSAAGASSTTTSSASTLSPPSDRAIRGLSKSFSEMALNRLSANLEDMFTLPEGGSPTSFASNALGAGAGAGAALPSISGSPPVKSASPLALSAQSAKSTFLLASHAAEDFDDTSPPPLSPLPKVFHHSSSAIEGSSSSGASVSSGAGSGGGSGVSSSGGVGGGSMMAFDFASAPARAEQGHSDSSFAYSTNDVSNAALSRKLNESKVVRRPKKNALSAGSANQVNDSGSKISGSGSGSNSNNNSSNNNNSNSNSSSSNAVTTISISGVSDSTASSTLSVADSGSGLGESTLLKRPMRRETNRSIEAPRGGLLGLLNSSLSPSQVSSDEDLSRTSDGEAADESETRSSLKAPPPSYLPRTRRRMQDSAASSGWRKSLIALRDASIDEDVAEMDTASLSNLGLATAFDTTPSASASLAESDRSDEPSSEDARAAGSTADSASSRRPSIMSDQRSEQLAPAEGTSEPDVLYRVRAALAKAPALRTPDDISVLVQELQKTFAVFADLTGETARRELASSVKFVMLDERDAIVYLTDDASENQWYCVFTGGVDVIADGECVHHIGPGEGFGHEPFVVSGATRTDVVLLTSDEITELLNVSLATYERISKIVESSVMQVEDENGQVVLVLENRLRGEGGSRRNLTVQVSRATVDKLIERLVAEEAHIQDESFMQDFFLSYRTFISAPALLEQLHQHAELPSSRIPPPVVKGASAVVAVTKTNCEVIAECLVFWLTNYAHDFSGKSQELALVSKIAHTLATLGLHDAAQAVRTVLSQIIPPQPVLVVTDDETSNPASPAHSQAGARHLSATPASPASFASPTPPVQDEKQQTPEAFAPGHKRKHSATSSLFSLITATPPVSPAPASASQAATTPNAGTGSAVSSPTQPSGPPARGGNIGRSESSVSRSTKMSIRVKSLFHRATAEEKTSGSTAGGLTSAQTSAANSPAGSLATIPPMSSSQETHASSSSAAADASSMTTSVAKLKRFLTVNPEDDCEIIRVYRSDLSYRYVMVLPTTTAKEVVDELIELFGIQFKRGIDRNDYVLVYVSSNGKTSMVRNTRADLARYLSINSRYYLRCNANLLEKFPRPDPFALENESAVLSMDPLQLAKQLTLEDSALFRAIKSVHYVEYLWKLPDADPKGTETIHKFIERFNVINFWVVTEIVSTKDLKRRVQLVKTFIFMCHCFRCWGNFNSLFAVISGLAHSTVARLRLTWKNINKRTMLNYKQLEGLMNPSRNMGTYRNLLSAMPPSVPLVPFFPLLIKDLVFIHEGNPSKVDGLVNFDKRRLLCKTLRSIASMTSVGYRDVGYNFEAKINLPDTASSGTGGGSSGPGGAAVGSTGGMASATAAAAAAAAAGAGAGAATAATAAGGSSAGGSAGSSISGSVASIASGEDHGFWKSAKNAASSTFNAANPTSSMRKLFEKTRMKCYIEEYLKDIETKVETDLNKLNAKAQEIEQLSFQ